jgi:hypothetical protein
MERLTYTLAGIMETIQFRQGISASVVDGAVAMRVVFDDVGTWYAVHRKSIGVQGYSSPARRRRRRRSWRRRGCAAVVRSCSLDLISRRPAFLSSSSKVSADALGRVSPFSILRLFAFAPIGLFFFLTDADWTFSLVITTVV